MNLEHLTLNDINEKLEIALSSLLPEYRCAIQPYLVTPYLETRIWEYSSRDGQGEVLPCWIIADLRRLGISIGFAYSQYAHGHYENPWGLVSFVGKCFGANDGWYRSLEHAIKDSGYLEDMQEGG